ncbi:hypothetical protein Efla_003676 [Eimeria flavescens]
MRNQDNQMNWTTVVKRGKAARTSQQQPRRIISQRAPDPPPTVPSKAPSLEQWDAHWPTLACAPEAKPETLPDASPDIATCQQQPACGAVLPASGTATRPLEKKLNTDTTGSIKLPISYIGDDDMDYVDAPMGMNSGQESLLRHRQIRLYPPVFSPTDNDPVRLPMLQPKKAPDNDENFAAQEISKSLATRNEFCNLLADARKALQEKLELDLASRELLIRRYEVVSELKKLEHKQRKEEQMRALGGGRSASSQFPNPEDDTWLRVSQHSAGVGVIGNLLSHAHVEKEALMRSFHPLLKRLRHAIITSVMAVDPATYQDALRAEAELEQAISDFKINQPRHRHTSGQREERAAQRKQNSLRHALYAGSTSAEQCLQHRQRQLALRGRREGEEEAEEEEEEVEETCALDSQPPQDEQIAHYNNQPPEADTLLHGRYRNKSRMVGDEPPFPTALSHPQDLRAIVRSPMHQDSVKNQQNELPNFGFQKEDAQEQQNSPPFRREPVLNGLHHGSVPISQSVNNSDWQQPNKWEFQQGAMQSQCFTAECSGEARHDWPHHGKPIQFGTVEYKPHHRPPPGLRHPCLRSDSSDGSKRPDQESSTGEGQQGHSTKLLDQLQFLSERKSEQEEGPLLMGYEAAQVDQRRRGCAFSHGNFCLPLIQRHLQHKQPKWDTRFLEVTPEAQMGRLPQSAIPRLEMTRRQSLREAQHEQLKLPLSTANKKFLLDFHWSSEWPMDTPQQTQNEPLRIAAANEQSSGVNSRACVPPSQEHHDTFPHWTAHFAGKEKRASSPAPATACSTHPSIGTVAAQQLRPAQELKAESPETVLCPWTSSFEDERTFWHEVQEELKQQWNEQEKQELQATETQIPNVRQARAYTCSCNFTNLYFSGLRP